MNTISTSLDDRINFSYFSSICQVKNTAPKSPTNKSVINVPLVLTLPTLTNGLDQARPVVTINVAF